MRWRSLILVVSILGLLLDWTLAPAAVRAQDAVRVGTRVPAWVEAVAVPAEAPSFEGSYEELLDDRQIRVEGAGAQRFVRGAYRIHTASGVQHASELSVDLAADDSLEWHYIRRVRGDATEELLHAGSVRLVQPEARLHEGLYDERRRAIVFLEDIRPGDRVEYAHTTHRSYAPYGGRFATAEGFGGRRAMGRVRLRVSWPPTRSVHVGLDRVPSSWVRERAPGSLLIETTRLPARASITGAPAWYWPHAFVELSEFDDWGEVAAWMTAAYEEAAGGELPESIPMEHILAAPTLAGRVERALRYVQDDIRYLGLEMGERAVVPHSPRVVAERRFGDCKDKSLLLVVILRHLGVVAHPALAHTQLRETIESRLPAPTQFDHVIVRAELAGEVLWLDPTRRAERGPLADRPPPEVGRALVGRAETRALSIVPVASLDEPTTDLVERFEVRDSRTTFVCTSVFRGSAATAYRQLLDARTSEEILRDAAAFYVGRGLPVDPTGPLEVHDDPDTGEIRVIERYAVDRFWDDGRRDVSPWAIFDRVALPPRAREEAPFFVSYPMHVRHRVEVLLRPPLGGWGISPSERTMVAGPVAVTRRLAVDGSLLTITVEARSSADHVPAAEVDAYRERVEALDVVMGYEVLRDGGSPTTAGETPDDVVLLLCVGGPFFLFGAVIFGHVGSSVWRGRRRRAFQRRQRAARGESPETAVEASDLADAQGRAPRITCCGQAATDDGWSTAAFDGVRLGIHASVCEACGKRHRRYFRLLG